jgi:hypothetical protein
MDGTSRQLCVETCKAGKVTERGEGGTIGVDGLVDSISSKPFGVWALRRDWKSSLGRAFEVRCGQRTARIPSLQMTRPRLGEAIAYISVRGLASSKSS